MTPCGPGASCRHREGAPPPLADPSRTRPHTRRLRLERRHLGVPAGDYGLLRASRRVRAGGRAADQRIVVSVAGRQLARRRFVDHDAWRQLDGRRVVIRTRRRQLVGRQDDDERQLAVLVGRRDHNERRHDERRHRRDSADAKRPVARIRLAGLLAAFALLLCAPAASAGVVVHGRSWLGGHGVDVCYPAGGGCGGNAPVGTPWQCVELAQRLYNHLGWWGGIFGGVHFASQIYDWARSAGMSVHRNGSGYIPVPGDMIVSGPTRQVGAGHVAVVDTVDLDRRLVHAVEQNADPSGRSTYRLRGSTLSRPGAYGNILGVVHSPRDHFNAYGWDGRFHDGSIYRDGLHGRLYLVAGGARIALNGARNALGYGRARIQPVPRGRIPRLPAMPREGTLLRAPGVQGLWLIHRRRRFHVLKRGHHRLFVVPASRLASIPVGTHW